MKALLIDDDARMLCAFQSELLGVETSVGLVNVESARGARQVLAERRPFDCIVLDLQLTRDNGFDLLSELCHAHPSVPVIAVSDSGRDADAVRAIYLGAIAFVPRRAGARGLVAALGAVRAGSIHVVPAAAPVAEPRDAPSSLTPRQTDVLKLLMRGQSNKTMARALNLSVDTVKDHVTAVLRCLDVKSRMQAVLAVSGAASGGPAADRTWPGRSEPAVVERRAAAPWSGESTR